MTGSATCPQCGQPMLTAALCGHCLLRAGSDYEYGVVTLLGQGAHGTVYLAEQQPGGRLVALKVLHASGDPDVTVARLRQHRRALDTATITSAARMLDVGLTNQRRPYVATEYIRGLPITSYCERWGVTRAERLRLIDGLRHGIQAAHKAGLVHGALKPSNVLVIRSEGVPCVKIVDFGLYAGDAGTDLAALAALSSDLLRTVA